MSVVLDIKNEHSGPFLRSGEMWCCAGGCYAGEDARRKVAVDPNQPPGFDELVDQAVVPVPAPGEPPRGLALGHDDGGAHACADEVAECAPGVAGAARLPMHLVPAGE